MAIVIDKHRCPQNHRCPIMRVCPVNAISQNGNGLPEVDQEKCVHCGRCIGFCATGAISMV